MRTAMAENLPPDPLFRKTVTILNNRGLHARAAAKFVKTTEHFRCEIKVCHKDQTACGRSILELLMLAAMPGSQIEIITRGSDAQRAAETLYDLVAAKFGEE